MSEVKQTVAVGCDHAGTELSAVLMQWLSERGYSVIDCGCPAGETADYPDIAQRVCGEVIRGIAQKGLLVCGTGIGMSMAANKIPGIRAAVSSDHYSVKYTRLHNDANVLCLGARLIGSGLAEELLELFLTTAFEGGRHLDRVQKIMDLEK